jgi:hypothetical protein
LGGRNNRMRGGVRVFTGMAIRRAITTKCDAALLTRAQMYPLRADLHALGAFAVGRFDRQDRVEMRATPVRHHLILAVLDEQPQRQSILRPPPKRLV